MSIPPKNISKITNRDEWLKSQYFNKDDDAWFLRRMYNPDLMSGQGYEYKDEAGNMTRATHKMATSSADGKHYVYPTVYQENNQWVDGGENAFNRAMETGDYLSFDDLEDANWFAENNYKNLQGTYFNGGLPKEQSDSYMNMFKSGYQIGNEGGNYFIENPNFGISSRKVLKPGEYNYINNLMTDYNSSLNQQPQTEQQQTNTEIPGQPKDNNFVNITMTKNDNPIVTPSSVNESATELTKSVIPDNIIYETNNKLPDGYEKITKNELPKTTTNELLKTANNLDKGDKSITDEVPPKTTYADILNKAKESDDLLADEAKKLMNIKNIYDFGANTSALLQNMLGPRPDTLSPSLIERPHMPSARANSTNDLMRAVASNYATGRQIVRESGRNDMMPGMVANMIDAEAKGKSDIAKNELQRQAQEAQLQYQTDAQNSQTINNTNQYNDQKLQQASLAVSQANMQLLSNYSKSLANMIESKVSLENQGNMTNTVLQMIELGMNEEQINKYLQMRLGGMEGNTNYKPSQANINVAKVGIDSKV